MREPLVVRENSEGPALKSFLSVFILAACLCSVIFLHATLFPKEFAVGVIQVGSTVRIDRQITLFSADFDTTGTLLSLESHQALVKCSEEMIVPFQDLIEVAPITVDERTGPRVRVSGFEGDEIYAFIGTVIRVSGHHVTVLINVETVVPIEFVREIIPLEPRSSITSTVGSQHSPLSPSGVFSATANPSVQQSPLRTQSTPVQNVLSPIQSQFSPALRSPVQSQFSPALRSPVQSQFSPNLRGPMQSPFSPIQSPLYPSAPQSSRQLPPDTHSSQSQNLLAMLPPVFQPPRIIMEDWFFWEVIREDPWYSERRCTGLGNCNGDHKCSEAYYAFHRRLTPRLKDHCRLVTRKFSNEYGGNSHQLLPTTASHAGLELLDWMGKVLQNPASRLILVSTSPEHTFMIEQKDNSFKIYQSWEHAFDLRFWTDMNISPSHGMCEPGNRLIHTLQDPLERGPLEMTGVTNDWNSIIAARNHYGGLRELPSFTPIQHLMRQITHGFLLEHNLLSSYNDGSVLFPASETLSAGDTRAFLGKNVINLRKLYQSRRFDVEISFLQDIRFGDPDDSFWVSIGESIEKYEPPVSPVDGSMEPFDDATNSLSQLNLDEDHHD